MDDLKELLSEKAQEMRLSPEPPPSVLRRARRRRAATAALAGVLTVGVALGTVVGVRAALKPSAYVPVNPSPMPSPVASPTPQDVNSLGPDFLVALKIGSGDPVGSVVLVDTYSGRVLRTVLPDVDLSEGFGDLALTSDGSALYYTQGVSACEGRIERVAIQGGQPEVVAADGYMPAPSPDGSLLAYLQGVSVGCPNPTQQLVVRDLATGAETRWDLGFQPREGAFGVCRLVWRSDSRRLVFNICSDNGDQVRMLDVQAERGVLLTETRVVVDPKGASLQLIGLHALTGGIAAIKSCTGQRVQSQQGDCPEPIQVVSIDPDRAQISEPLLEVPPGVTEMRLDGSGRYFLWVTEDHGVFGWDSGQLGAPVEIASGYSQVTW